MYANEKSDKVILPEKQSNNEGVPSAENVEERGLTEGNAIWQNKPRALNRERGENGKI